MVWCVVHGVASLVVRGAFVVCVPYLAVWLGTARHRQTGVHIAALFQHRAICAEVAGRDFLLHLCAFWNHDAIGSAVVRRQCVKVANRNGAAHE